MLADRTAHGRGVCKMCVVLMQIIALALMDFAILSMKLIDHPWLALRTTGGGVDSLGRGARTPAVSPS